MASLENNQDTPPPSLPKPSHLNLIKDLNGIQQIIQTVELSKHLGKYALKYNILINYKVNLFQKFRKMCASFFKTR